MIKKLFVNKVHLKANQAGASPPLPTVTMWTRDHQEDFIQVDITGPAKLVSFPQPDECGAHSFIETESKVVCHREDGTTIEY